MCGGSTPVAWPAVPLSSCAGSRHYCAAQHTAHALRKSVCTKKTQMPTSHARMIPGRLIINSGGGIVSWSGLSTDGGHVQTGITVCDGLSSFDTLNSGSKATPRNTSSTLVWCGHSVLPVGAAPPDELLQVIHVHLPCGVLPSIARAHGETQPARAVSMVVLGCHHQKYKLMVGWLLKNTNAWNFYFCSEINHHALIFDCRAGGAGWLSPSGRRPSSC